MFTLKNYFYKNYSNYQILKTIKCISFFTGLQNMSFATFHVFEDSCFLVFYNVFKMECYATPWPLWRESRNLFFIEPSFAFSAPLSLYLLLIAHSFLFPLGGCVHIFQLKNRNGKFVYKSENKCVSIHRYHGSLNNL